MFLSIQKNINFVANEAALWNFYAPIIGLEPVGLYLWLCHLTNHTNSFVQLTENQLSSSLKTDPIRLMDQLSILVDVQLVKIYENINQPQHYLVEIKRPYNQNEILNNHILTTKLQSTLGYSEFAILIDQTKIPTVDQSFIDVSDQYQSITNSSNVNKLVNQIFNQFNLSLNLDHKTNKLLKQAFILFNDNYEFIYKLVCDSVIIKDNDDYISLDCALFESNLNQQLNNYNSSKLLVNIRRNKAIFNQSSNLADFSEVISDYEQYDPKKYFTLIMKRNLSSNELDSIQPLLKCMPNSFANMIIDYVLIKNHGRLVKEYLIKIRDSVLLNNFDNLADLLQYLKNAYSNIGFNTSKTDTNHKLISKQELTNSKINYKELFDI
ncbi:hypothetical protein JM47_00400 [Ureaplasma diversum]|uniref:Chromosome replication initiation/membrane attachment protein n=2 Tax=Ureaplasma diversum TaxID=42094 RepID=A0A084EZ04_9BACT|nr:hypothetical protein [Ureaplasma diversum]AJQ45122.1 hypothetical protein JM47_00400 [Ureaplasma diversum]KEZ23196.1 Chromosome replication initiation/membrane attachment protein [Ureaplasma diversum NCTC 246]